MREFNQDSEERHQLPKQHQCQSPRLLYINAHCVLIKQLTKIGSRLTENTNTSNVTYAAQSLKHPFTSGCTWGMPITKSMAQWHNARLVNIQPSPQSIWENTRKSIIKRLNAQNVSIQQKINTRWESICLQCIRKTLHVNSGPEETAKILSVNTNMSQSSVNMATSAEEHPATSSTKIQP